jgi:hypothetical protein
VRAPRTERMAIAAELVAVLVAVTDAEPRVLTIRDTSSLPSGPLSAGHSSLQSGLRAWVERQTHHPLGYVAYNAHSEYDCLGPLACHILPSLAENSFGLRGCRDVTGVSFADWPKRSLRSVRNSVAMPSRENR